MLQPSAANVTTPSYRIWLGAIEQFGKVKRDAAIVLVSLHSQMAGAIWGLQGPAWRAEAQAFPAEWAPTCSFAPSDPYVAVAILRTERRRGRRQVFENLRGCDCQKLGHPCQRTLQILVN